MSILSVIASKAKIGWSRGTSRIAESWLTAKSRLGLPLSEFSAPGGTMILMYHGVVPERANRFNWRHISISDFECHLRILRKNSNILSLADLHAGNLCSKRLNVAITFDDGFRNNYLYALPLLEKYQAPASFYITGANDIGVGYLWPDFLDIVSRYADGPIRIEDLTFEKRGKVFIDQESGDSLAAIIKHRRPNWAFKQGMFDAFRRWEPNLYRPDYRSYWELMSDAEIRQASDSQWVTIGCHGYYHNNLGELALDDALGELQKSRTYLERITGKSVRELAFPDGSYSGELMSKVGAAGFDVVLGTEHRFGETPLCSTPYRRAGIYSYHRRATQLGAAVADACEGSR